MNEIAEVLRSAATRILEHVDYNVSPYICDALGNVRARNFLFELGMGQGLRVFGPGDIEDNFPEHIQHERAAWCLFAADLAEEWGVE